MFGIDLAVIGVSLFKALLPLGIMGIGYLGKQLDSYLRAHATGAAATTALNLLDSLTTAVVTDLQANVVPGLRAKLANGTLSVEDAHAVKQQAIDTILSFVRAQGMEFVEKGLPVAGATLEKLVAHKVETAVYDLKYPGQKALPQFTQGPATAPVTGGLPPFRVGNPK